MRLNELSVGNTFTYENKQFQVVEKQSDGLLVKDTKNRLHLLAKSIYVDKK